jgi:hypothetical protein
MNSSSNIFHCCNCMSPLLALSGRRWVADQCQLSGVKQTSQYDGAVFAFDPERTLLPLHITQIFVEDL